MVFFKLMFCPYLSQIEDLSQQAQRAAANKFKVPEPSSLAQEQPNVMAPTIQEESEEDEEVGCFKFKPVWIA